MKKHFAFLTATLLAMTLGACNTTGTSTSVSTSITTSTSTSSVEASTSSDISSSLTTSSISSSISSSSSSVSSTSSGPKEIQIGEYYESHSWDLTIKNMTKTVLGDFWEKVPVFNATRYEAVMGYVNSDILTFRIVCFGVNSSSATRLYKEKMEAYGYYFSAEGNYGYQMVDYYSDLFLSYSFEALDVGDSFFVIQANIQQTREVAWNSVIVDLYTDITGVPACPAESYSTSYDNTKDTLTVFALFVDKNTVTNEYVQEFGLGMYAYDAIYNKTADIAAGRRNAENKANLLPDDSATINSTTTNAKTYFENLGIGTIPYGAAVALASAAEIEDADGVSINDGNATFYPRNVIFNKYFNKHNVAVIVPNEIAYNVATNDNPGAIEAYNDKGTASATYAALPGFSVNTKGLVDVSARNGGTNENVLTDKAGRIVLAVRAGASGSYEGIHFIVINRSALDEFGSSFNGTDAAAELTAKTAGTATLSQYYTIHTPEKAEYPTVSETDKTGLLTYTNFIKGGTNTPMQRSDTVRTKIKGYNNNLNIILNSCDIRGADKGHRNFANTFHLVCCKETTELSAIGVSFYLYIHSAEMLRIEHDETCTSTEYWHPVKNSLPDRFKKILITYYSHHSRTLTPRDDKSTLVRILDKVIPIVKIANQNAFLS